MKSSTLAAILVLFGAACASTPPNNGAPVQTQFPEDDLSNRALDELADNVVTYQEYRDAFERYRDCIVASGETLTGGHFDPLSGLATGYSVSTGDDICYDREFFAADVAWQLDPNRPRSRDELVQMATLKSCIEAMGIEPVDATTQHELYRQIMDLGVLPSDCFIPPTTSAVVVSD